MSDITRGGQFLVKETKCDDIFTPEDFSEEQIMMRESVKEFVEKGEILACTVYSKGNILGGKIFRGKDELWRRIY